MLKQLKSLVLCSFLLASCATNLSLNNDKNTQPHLEYVVSPLNSYSCEGGYWLSPSKNSIAFSAHNTPCIPYLLDINESNKSWYNNNLESRIINYYYGNRAPSSFRVFVESFNKKEPQPNWNSWTLENTPYQNNMKEIVDNALSCVASINESKPLIVFDIDDTLISDFQGSVSESFLRYNESNYNLYIYNSYGLAVPYMIKLLKYAEDHNVDVAFITGRKGASLYEATKNNLLKAYPTQKIQLEKAFSKNLLLLNYSKNYYLDSDVTTDVWKNIMRESLIKQGYHIILNMGDQYSDLNYVYPYKNPPSCSYKLPNYMYYIK